MDFIQQLLEQLDYGMITLLMTLESTVVPVPSELVVTPAAYYACRPNADMNIYLIIFFATLGADMGASINYVAAKYLGRPVVYKFANSKLGKMCLLNEEKVKHTEKYFDDHGVTSTLIGRLIPGIRHLISIPAGLAQMHYGKFLHYTTIGAGVWHSILAVLGWYLHSFVPEDQLNDKIMEYGDIIKWTIIALVIAAIVYFVVNHYVKKAKKD